MSYEPFRGAPPPHPQPQSYDEFRATEKPIELTDINTHPDSTNSSGSSGLYLGTSRPPPSPPAPPGTYNLGSTSIHDRHIPGKFFWSKIRLALRFLSFLCSLCTLTLVAAVLGKYNQTKNQRNASEPFWPKNPKLQPTIYMLVAAALTIFVHIGLITSHFLNVTYYYTVVFTKRDRISIWIQFFLCLIWIVGGFLARLYTSDQYGNGNDLLTWTCEESWHRNTVAVNFAMLCGQLMSAFYIAYLNAFLEFLSLLTFSLNSFWAGRSGYQRPVFYN